MARDVDALSSFTQLADVIEKPRLIHFGPANAGRASRGNEGLDYAGSKPTIRARKARGGASGTQKLKFPLQTT